MSKLQKYVLKPGYKHHQRQTDGSVTCLEAGSVVELNENQAANFAERFELLASVQARAEADAAMAAAATAEAAELDATPAPAPVVVDEATATVTSPPAAGDGAPVEPAPTEPAAAPEPEAFDPVDVEEYTADGLIEKIAELDNVAAITQIGDDEQARKSKARSTVLTAVDERLDALGVE